MCLAKIENRLKKTPQPVSGQTPNQLAYDNLMTLGDGILLVSSELSEIMTLSDRIYVIYEGRINGEFVRGDIDEKSLGLLMVGGHV